MSNGIGSSALFLLVGLAMGYQQDEARLPFRWHFGASEEDLLRMSSVVFIGRVQSIELVGPTVDGTDDHGYHAAWQLVRVAASVENLLEGEIPSRPAEFCFYTTSGPISGDTNSLKVGNRYVFLLVSENGLLRAVRDLWRSSIEVGTGRHAVGPPGPGQKLEDEVATILLTPGEDINPKIFERVIVRSVPIAESWLDHCRVLHLLATLARYPNEVVRKAAAEQLAIRVTATDSCGPLQ